MSCRESVQGRDSGPGATQGARNEIDDLTRKNIELFDAAAAQLERGAEILAILCADNPRLEFCRQPPRKIVFVASGSFYGNLPSVGAADLFCNSRAQKAGHEGYFKAWISDSASTAPVVTFARSTDPYVLPDGTLVAADWTALTTSNLAHPINQDEYGNEIDSLRVAWASTYRTREHIVFSSNLGPFAPDCDNWTSADPFPAETVLGGVGSTNATDAEWSFAGGDILDIFLGGGSPFAGLRECAQQARLYCFEQ